jgi:hypothetical protein
MLRIVRRTRRPSQCMQARSDGDGRPAISAREFFFGAARNSACRPDGDRTAAEEVLLSRRMERLLGVALARLTFEIVVDDGEGGDA